MDAHIHPEHPPYMLQIPRFLWLGCTSNRFCEVEVCFFNALPMAFFPTGVSRTIFACSSRSLNVHLEWPTGAGVQATSIMRASALPSSLRLALSEFMFRFKVTVASSPSSTYCLTVFVTVAMQTPVDFAACSCVKSFPWASSKSRRI